VFLHWRSFLLPSPLLLFCQASYFFFLFVMRRCCPPSSRLVPFVPLLVLPPTGFSFDWVPGRHIFLLPGDRSSPPASNCVGGVPRRNAFPTVSPGPGQWVSHSLLFEFSIGLRVVFSLPLSPASFKLPLLSERFNLANPQEGCFTRF